MLVIFVCSENENGGKMVSLLMSNKLSEMCTMGMVFNIFNKQLNGRPSEASWEEVPMQSPKPPCCVKPSDPQGQKMWDKTLWGRSVATGCRQ